MDSKIMSCRLCLQVKNPKKLNSIHDPLKNMENFSIADGIFQISGTKVDQNDRFSTSICNKCLTNLQTSISFRNLCINSDKYYKNMITDFEVFVKEEPLEISEIKVQEMITENPTIEDETHHSFSYDDKVSIPALPDESWAFSDPEKNSILKAEKISIPSMSDKISIPSSSFTKNRQPRKTNLKNTIKLEESTSHLEIKEDLKQKPRSRIRKPRGTYKTKQKEPLNEGERCCSVCGKLYKSWKECYNHERSHRKIERPDNLSYTCDFCGKSFKVKSYLVAHMNNSHVSEKRYKCTHCPKQFSRSYFFKIHLRYHNNDRPHKCSYCGKGFPKKQSLVVHIRGHTGEKPYKCQYCDKAYIHFTDHKRHVFSHTGNYPYKCTICLKGFAKKSFLTQHEKTHPTH